ncbi:hypothetical protein PQX77_004285 [Marasmius sp. AFHP31]|nr:hypothetical protein PQX77_004285 [Marasmius sp. AFHP31]
MSTPSTTLDTILPTNLASNAKSNLPDAHRRLPMNGPIHSFRLGKSTLPSFEIGGLTSQVDLTIARGHVPPHSFHPSQVGFEESLSSLSPVKEPIGSLNVHDELSFISRTTNGGAFSSGPSSTRTTILPGWLIISPNNRAVFTRTLAQTNPTKFRQVLFSNPHHAYMMLTTTRSLSLCRTSSPSSLNHAPSLNSEFAYNTHDERSFDLKALLDGNRDPCVQPEMFNLPGVQHLHAHQGARTQLQSGVTLLQHSYKEARLPVDSTLPHSQWAIRSESPVWSNNSTYNSPLSTASSSTKGIHEQTASPFDNMQQPTQTPSIYHHPPSDLFVWPGQYDISSFSPEHSHIADPASIIAPDVGSVRGIKRSRSPSTPTTSPSPGPSTQLRYPRHRRSKKNKGADIQTATCSWLIPDENGALVHCGEAFTNRTLPTHMREHHQPWVRDEYGAMVPCPDNHELRCEWAGCQQLMKWGQLSRHIRTDLGWTVVNCPFCRKVLSRKDALDRHLRTNSCPGI